MLKTNVKAYIVSIVGRDHGATIYNFSTNMARARKMAEELFVEDYPNDEIRNTVIHEVVEGQSVAVKNDA